jgi:DNA-binding CsgD family transcriptional regulator
MNKFILTLLYIFLFCFISATESKEIGSLKGKISPHNKWEPVIYLSIIDKFEKLNSMSENMIINSQKLDSEGNFEISFEKLPTTWTLVRIHMVSKGYPATSLTIGGINENFFIFIANRFSKLSIIAGQNLPLFNNANFQGDKYISTFNYVNNINKYSQALLIKNSNLIEKEFVDKVILEKLKSIADTCSNFLLSLYTLNKIDYKTDIKKDPEFYKDYLAKRENESSYMEEFKKSIQIQKSYWPLYLGMIIFSIGLFLFLYIYKSKPRKLNSLSVQEHKIYKLLEQGASNQEISDNCNIEISTVKSHVSSIFTKLNIRSRKELIRK